MKRSPICFSSEVRAPGAAELCKSNFSQGRFVFKQEGIMWREIEVAPKTETEWLELKVRKDPDAQKWLEEHKEDLIALDDGYEHRKVILHVYWNKDGEIVREKPENRYLHFRKRTSRDIQWKKMSNGKSIQCFHRFNNGKATITFQNGETRKCPECQGTGMREVGVDDSYFKEHPRMGNAMKTSFSVSLATGIVRKYKLNPKSTFNLLNQIIDLDVKESVKFWSWYHLFMLKSNPEQYRNWISRKTERDGRMLLNKSLAYMPRRMYAGKHVCSRCACLVKNANFKLCFACYDKALNANNE